MVCHKRLSMLEVLLLLRWLHDQDGGWFINHFFFFLKHLSKRMQGDLTTGCSLLTILFLTAVTGFFFILEIWQIDWSLPHYVFYWPLAITQHHNHWYLKSSFIQRKPNLHSYNLGISMMHSYNLGISLNPWHIFKCKSNYSNLTEKLERLKSALSLQVLALVNTNVFYPGYIIVK